MLGRMTRYTKKQMAKHIRDFFAERPETIRPTRWACIIKGGKLMVVRRLMVMPTDIIITESILEPDQLPSWLLVYWCVWKNWRTLVAANIKISGTNMNV